MWSVPEVFTRLWRQLRWRAPSTIEGMGMGWRYFGRTGGTGEVYELYRCPANGVALFDQPGGAIHRLRKNGSWTSDPIGERAIANEEATGYFDEKSDELTEEQALHLFEEWRKHKWPGRD